MSDLNLHTAPQKILLATDLSARCDRALDRATQLACQWNAQLHIVHAIESTSYDLGISDLDKTPSWRYPPDLKLSIERQIRRDMPAEINGFTVHLEEGPASEVILNAVVREKCDLVIVGIGRESYTGRKLLENTLESLVRRCPSSVLIVKNRPHGPYRHILIGTDFTPESKDGLIAATVFFPDATYMLMHAFKMPYRSLLEANQLSRDFAAMETATIQDFLDEAGISTVVRARLTTTIEHGPPENMLRAYVMEKEADLTVIGALGRNFLFQALIGGTAPRIVEAVPSDVLVVRATV